MGPGLSQLLFFPPGTVCSDTEDLSLTPPIAWVRPGRGLCGGALTSAGASHNSRGLLRALGHRHALAALSVLSTVG